MAFFFPLKVTVSATVALLRKKKGSMYMLPFTNHWKIFTLTLTHIPKSSSYFRWIVLEQTPYGLHFRPRPGQ